MIDIYYHEKARLKPSGRVVIQAMRDLRAVLGDIAVEDFDADRQLELIEGMRARGLADSTIKMRVDRIVAGARWVKRRRPKIARYQLQEKVRAGDDWELDKRPAKRPYELQELAALFNTAAELGPDGQRAREAWWRYLWLALATAGRPTAVHELSWKQIDLKVRRIYLQPEGQKENKKKRRATVAIGETIVAEISSWERGGRFVISRGALPLSNATFFSGLRRAAGVRGSANLIRHTVRTWLAIKGVDPGQCDFLMGHAAEGSRTGAQYTHLEPSYLKDVVAALEELYGEIGRQRTLSAQRT